MSERQFNAQIDELLENLENTLPKRYGQVTRSADRARLIVEDVLAKYADGDGKIPRNKQAAVLRDIQKIEGQIYRDIRNELQMMFNATADTTTMGLALAVSTAIDTATLLSVMGISKEFTEATMMFLALTGKSVTDFARDIAKTPFNRKDSDGLRLNDRLADIARVILREVSSTLRLSIQKGEVTSRMNRKIQNAFKTLAWRLKTIVETELLFLHRNAIGIFAELSGIAYGVRIQDYPHGNPGEHERHACYVYAHADEHGMGRGVYPASTRKIRHPHPRCRSTLHLVFIDKLA